MAVVMYVLAPLFAKGFTKDENLMRISIYTMRAAATGFTFIAPGMLTSNYFQSIGKAALAMFFSLTRQVFFLLPVLIAMPRMIGFNGIWWSGPISDTLGGVLAIAMAVHEIRKLSRMEDAKA